MLRIIDSGMFGTAVVSKGPPCGANEDNKQSFIICKSYTRTEPQNSSSVFHLIFLASGDDSISSGDLGHYCPEIIMFALCMLNLSG